MEMWWSNESRAATALSVFSSRSAARRPAERSPAATASQSACAVPTPSGPSLRAPFPGESAEGVLVLRERLCEDRGGQSWSRGGASTQD